MVFDADCSVVLVNYNFNSIHFTGGLSLQVFRFGLGWALDRTWMQTVFDADGL